MNNKVLFAAFHIWHNKFSRFYQIIFSNSLQAPKKEQALLQSAAFHPTLLSRSLCLFRRLNFAGQNRHRSQSTMINYSTIHVFIANYPTMHPRSPRLEDGGLTLCLMINVINLSLFIPLMNKWSLGIRDSGSQKHERHDLPFFNLTSWNPGTMHTMRCSSEHS